MGTHGNGWRLIKNVIVRRDQEAPGTGAGGERRMIFCPYISMRMGSLESERDYWKRESDRLYQVAKSEHIRSTIRFEIIQKHGLINEMRVAMGLEPHPSFDLAEESQP